MRAALIAALVLLATLAAAAGSASASTVQPVTPPSTSSACQPGGLFGHVAPEGNALVGLLYIDPESGNPCILNDGATIPGDTIEIWLYTPTTPAGNGTVPIGVEEFQRSTHEVAEPGPNGTVYDATVPYLADVVWSNATVTAAAGEYQSFDLQVPPVFVSPSAAHNLSITILGLSLDYLIATPGTALPVPETVGSLVEWLGLMAPFAVVSFIAGFGPGEVLVRRLRYISTGRWAAGFCLLLTVGIAGGVTANFTGFLYWLGNVGILGLGVLLLFPLFCWGSALWITVRGKGLKSRLIRAPIAKTDRGDPVVGVSQVKVYGGGDTGHEEEVVEGFGIGGASAAFYRMLGVRTAWRPDKLARTPRFIRYDWTRGRLGIEGEYATWPGADGKDLDYQVRKPELVWFPWRKSVKAKFDAKPGEAIDRVNDGVKAPENWAHRGFLVGLRHGEVKVGALGSPDYVGPDQYIRGVAPAAAFGRESQRRGTMIVLLNEQMEARAEVLANERVAIRDRLQAFPGSPEAMEGLRELSTRRMGPLFDDDAYMHRLEERGKMRVDYRPPGAKSYSASSETLTIEAAEPRPPELRDDGGKKRS